MNSRHPYDESAEIYLSSHLWPIPVAGKNPPIIGATGYKGTVTDQKVAHWLDPDKRWQLDRERNEWYRLDNVGLRHQLTVAIDVDAGYGEKDGVEQLAVWAAKLGLPPLPPTWSSTARGDDSPSRQYVYRISEDVKFRTKPCRSVELCTWHHRFTVCAPSVHPDTGSRYAWYLPGEAGVPPTWGERTDRYPTLDVFADLPVEWFNALRGGVANADHSAITVELPELLASFAEGEPDAYVVEQIDKWANLGNHLGHDETKNALIHAFMLGREGHVGVPGLVSLIVQRFADYVAEVRPQEAEKEIESLVRACAQIAQQKPTEDDKWARFGIDITKLEARAMAPEVSSVLRMDSGVPASTGDGQEQGSEDFEYGIGAAEPPQNSQAPGSEDFEYQFLGGAYAPIPLPGLTDELPLPASCPELSDYVSELADALQVPRDMPMTMALTLLAAAAKGGWEVVVQPGWMEPLSICALICQGSGERKSPVLRALEGPLREYQAQERERAAPGHRTQETKAQLARKRYESAMTKAGKSEDPDAESDALRLYDAWQVAQGSVEPLPTWVVGADGTPEAFVDLLVKHRALGIITAEPGLFGILGGRYSSGSPNIEWFLHATAGEPLDTHRIGRDAGSVDRPVLSALSCIQPGRLRELGEKPEFRASGLLARHLFCIAPTMLGRRERPRDIEPQLASQWRQRVFDLLNKSNKINSGYTNCSVQLLRCTPEAAELLARFEDELEPELTPHTGRYCEIGDWIGKATGTAARIAGLLTLFNNPGAEEVGVDSTRDAIGLVSGYISHTIAAFGLTDPDNDVIGHAQEVLTVAREVGAAAGQSWFTRRDVHQKIRGRKWARRAEALDGPLDLLAAHGFIVVPEVDVKAAPGRPPERYLLNPAEARSRIAPARPRTPRNRSSKSSEPAQSGSPGHSVKAEVPRIHPQNPQNLPEWPTAPLSDSSTWPPCRQCGAPLYLVRQGRDLCARCSPPSVGGATNEQLAELGLIPAPESNGQAGGRR